MLCSSLDRITVLARPSVHLSTRAASSPFLWTRKQKTADKPKMVCFQGRRRTRSRGEKERRGHPTVFV